MEAENQRRMELSRRGLFGLIGRTSLVGAAFLLPGCGKEEPAARPPAGPPGGDAEGDDGAGEPAAGEGAAEAEGEGPGIYVCDNCRWAYDPARGDPRGGIAAGTAFADVPDEWVCPRCGYAKGQFSPQG